MTFISTCGSAHKLLLQRGTKIHDKYVLHKHTLAGISTQQQQQQQQKQLTSQATTTHSPITNNKDTKLLCPTVIDPTSQCFLNNFGVYCYVSIKCIVIVEWVITIMYIKLKKSSLKVTLKIRFVSISEVKRGVGNL